MAESKTKKCEICGFRLSPVAAKQGNDVCKMCIHKGLNKEQ